MDDEDTYRDNRNVFTLHLAQWYRFNGRKNKTIRVKKLLLTRVKTVLHLWQCAAGIVKIENNLEDLFKYCC